MMVSWITVIWSMISSACLTLAVVHLLAWSGDRRLRANLHFAILAVSFATFAFCELLLMKSATAAEYLRLHQLAHVPMAFTVVFLATFVDRYFGTGRRWLLGTILALRAAVLILAFVPGPTFNFLSIDSLAEVRVFGETVAAPRGRATPWARLGELSVLLTIAFVGDAALRLWSRGGSEERRRSLRVGGAVLLCVAPSLVFSFLLHSGRVEMPYAISITFMLIIGAMGMELSRDLIRSARLTKQLREQTESTRLAAEAARLALWNWDIAADRIWVNPLGRRLYDIPAGEPIGFERFLATLHPDDRETTAAAVSSSLATSTAYHAEYRVVRSDGSIRWIEARGQVETSGGESPLRMRGVSIDVTERHQMQERLRLIVEASPNGVILAEKQGRILLANASAESMFGHPRGGMNGLGIEDLMPERFRAAHHGLRAGFHQSPESRAMGAGRDLFGKRRDGSEFPLEIGLTPVESAEGDLVLAIIIDISSRRRAEEEAQQLRRDLAHASRVTLLGQLSSALAHELSQPLGAILRNAEAAELILATPAPDLDELREIVRDIHADDQRAGAVIDRLRALLKRSDLALEPVAIPEIAAEVRSLVRSDTSARGIAVSHDFPADLPRVRGDRVHLLQVLLNLVVNAMDAIEHADGGERRIHLSARPDGDGFLEIIVRDSGPGIPADRLEQVFVPFHTTKPHGMGMGLPVCRTIVEAHHGTLRAEIPTGTGAEFHIRIPTTTDD